VVRSGGLMSKFYVIVGWLVPRLPGPIPMKGFSES
jgi:hypothetical protein